MGRIAWFLSIVLLTACRDPYYPDVKPVETNVLVVEGFINIGTGPTNIRLGRTVSLQDSVAFKAERGAAVAVVAEDNTVYPLAENGNGFYTAALNLSAAKKYRLRIRTVSGNEYLSELSAALPTPPIDSVSWRYNNDGVDIFVDTHDPQNNTRYYRWEYEETWEIRSRFFAAVKYLNNNSIVVRDITNPAENVYNCWRYQNSGSVIIGSSINLSSDVIHLKPLLSIPRGSEKISVRYSIRVRQYALDRGGYDFYQLMKKNTEELGSIFAAQPSDIRGNIRSVTNPQEPVIGYITVTTEAEKRIFIQRAEVDNPAWGYSYPCEDIEVANHPDSLRKYFPFNYLPYAEHREGPAVVGYYSSGPYCVDCTLRGSNVRPAYW